MGAFVSYFLFFLFFRLLTTNPSSSFNVTYDHRSLIIDGQHRILISGSIHYPRATPMMWPDLISKAKAGGIDVIQTYVFWNAHEPSPREYYFGDRLDLVSFVKSVQRAGLYVNLRIGPYITAEWNYGGLPVWLRNIPGMAFRTDNQPFKSEMQIFVTKIVEMMKAENLFHWQGGPIILAQIENEFGDGESAADTRYMLWAAHMAEAQPAGVPWIMCQQANAPDVVINTCNGFYCDWFNPNNINKPKMWTENWTGWFHNFGGANPHRPVEDIAYSTAKFFQKGGSFLNYYMYFGGTNFGRTAAGPFLGTSYDYDAPIDEYGLLHQPKWGHLTDLHRAVKLCEPVMTLTDPVYQNLGNSLEAYIYQVSGSCCAYLSNSDAAQIANVNFKGNKFSLPPWSVSILPDCKNVAFNTAKVVAQTSTLAMRPSDQPNSLQNWMSYQEPVGLWDNKYISANNLLEQISTTLDTTDYLWYTTSVYISAEDLRGDVQQQLTIDSTKYALHIYINGHFSGNHTLANSGLSISQPIKLIAGTNEIALLSMTVGLQDGGYRYDLVTAGLSGSIKLKGLQFGDKDLATQQWKYQVGLKGEALEIYTQKGAGFVQWTPSLQPPWTQYLTWYKSSFATPFGRDPVAIYLGSMGKGQAWVNGNNLGRFWPSLLINENDCGACDYRGTFTSSKCLTNCGQQSQQWYHIPREWLNQDTQNLLMIFDELGGDVSHIYVATKSVETVCVNVPHDQSSSYPPPPSTTITEDDLLLSTAVHAKLECPDNRLISSITFASFGNPQGNCNSFQLGNCHSTLSMQRVEKACVGKTSCSIPVSSTAFGADPCAGVSKRLAIEARCQTILSPN